MGPHVAIGSISLEMRQAHSMLSAASLRRSHGPIHDHRQYSSAAIIGPCKGIGRISQEKEWANS